MEHAVESNGHSTLVIDACILKAERHDCVVEVTMGVPGAFFIYCLICTSSSSLKFLGACFTGLIPSLIFNLCVTNC